MTHEHNQRELCQQVYACIKTLAQDILGKTTLRETGPPVSPSSPPTLSAVAACHPQ